MPPNPLHFDHIHLVSADPHSAAKWYVDILGGSIQAQYKLRGSTQIHVKLGGASLLIRGARRGESPTNPKPMYHFVDYSSHDVWGTDRFGFRYQGDLRNFCQGIKAKGAKVLMEPWEFAPNSTICYVAAPDGVSIELIESYYGKFLGTSGQYG